MPLTDPGTRSPGRLVLVYSHNTHVHRAGVNLTAAADIGDTVMLSDVADELADLVAANMANTCSISGYEVYNSDGDLLFSNSFAAVVPGARSVSSIDYESLTLTLLGSGEPLAVGNKHGNTRLVMFTGAGWSPTAGVQGLNVSAVPDVKALADYLIGSPDVWADFYGQKAGIRPRATFQFNAHAQKTIGT